MSTEQAELDPLLTIEEFAGQLRTSTKSVRRWIRDGKIAAAKLPGGQWRIRRSVLQRIITNTSH